MSDFDDFTASYRKHQKALAEANVINKAAVFDALSAAGISSVIVNFDGEGDSGQIEDITADANGNSLPLPDSQIEVQRITWGTGQQDSHRVTLADAIEQLCYDYLSQEHAGWENDDDGYGEFSFHVAERRIELDFNDRFTDSTHFNHTF